MQSFLNVITLQTYTFFTTLTPRLHGRSKRFFRRPQNLNTPRTQIQVFTFTTLFRLLNSNRSFEGARCPISRPTLKVKTISSCESLLFSSPAWYNIPRDWTPIDLSMITANFATGSVVIRVKVAAFVLTHWNESDKQKNVLLPLAQSVLGIQGAKSQQQTKTKFLRLTFTRFEHKKLKSFFHWICHWDVIKFNPLAPNDVYISRTAQLTSRRCVLNIYSTNILTEYFKHAAHSPFFFLFKMPFIS